ncbi:MAG: glutamine synthetase beta-grasp domain-containing protein [Planctomycetota bacterium]
MFITAEYIWLDGNQPTQTLRSKTRVLPSVDGALPDPRDLPLWSFDGSSTNQAAGGDSDLLLEPVAVVGDPIRGARHFLVMTEVLDPDGTPHSTNQRARLAEVLRAGAGEQQPWIGFEQEYTLFDGQRPLGWPEGGYPAPQGPFYCGVGTGRVFGRDLVEAHGRACLDAGLMLYGINAEVMPGQWEFQIGYRGVAGETADPLTVSDHLWLSRWLLQRLGEDAGIGVSFENKPVKGDWNGAGAHTNFSTRAMREPGGVAAIEDAISLLGARHDAHIAAYGAGLGERLTGLHETCSIDEFRGGVADRGASIRIPRHVAEQGNGYLEDRRPGANCDPYVVSRMLLETVCQPALEAQFA